MRKVYRKAIVVMAGLSVCMAGTASVTEAGMEMRSGNIENIVKQQQQQLDSQASEIQALKEQLKALLNSTKDNKEVLAKKVDREEIESINTDKMVVSSKSNVEVSIYGQVNRALLFADNGDTSDAYFVDNSASSTRMGITGTVEPSDGLTIGSKLEYELVSNASSKVNHFDKSQDAHINFRKAEVWLKSKAGGQLSIGQGATASDGTSENDLSGTNVIIGAPVGDMAGGQFWHDPAAEWYRLDDDGNLKLYGIKVGKSYSDMDGLSRRDRVRYDTPSFGGFSLAGSVMEDEGYDVALRYKRKFGDSALSSAVAWADSGDLKLWDTQVNGSISYLHSSGFNVTMAAGKQYYDLQNIEKDDPGFWYAKIGYKTQFFSIGKSAFAVDYGTWNDLAKNSDEAKAFGFGFVQNVDDWKTEFYLGYRLYSLDRIDTNYDDVNSVMTGARIKF